MGGDVEMSMMRRRAWRLRRASGDGTGTEITYGEHTKGHPKGHRVSRVSEPLIESMLFLSFAYKMPARPARVCRLESARTYGIACAHVRPDCVMNMPLTAKLLTLLSPDAQTLGPGDVSKCQALLMPGTRTHGIAWVVTWQRA